MLIGDHWAVELEDFGKHYPAGRGRTLPAVAGVSLKLARGQVLGLLGPNGSGKSTTLKALAGLIRPTAGACRILGHPAGSEAARARVGYLPETMRLVTQQTAGEFLRYCAALSSLEAVRAGARIRAVLAWAGLGGLADRRVVTLSKGQWQRLGLAQAVLHEPEVVLLDEPGSGLDPEGRLALTRLIRELAVQGRAVVLTAPLQGQAEVVCDRLALLDRGRLLASGPTTEILGGEAPTPPGPSRLERYYLEASHGHA